MPLTPNFGAQRLCHIWYGTDYYDGLARAFAHRLHWGIWPADSRVYLAKQRTE